MSERTPTPEQRRAIDVSGAEIMVEAGAGSGKTGVMVDRYCRLVCGASGVEPDQVLAFTFTDKAAAELRQRIRAELADRARQGSEEAARVLPAIGSAWVTTIHGFCNRLLAAHPVAVGVDPRFRVLDAPEAERTAREAFDEALAEFLAGGDREREATLAAFDLGGLRAIVIGAHAELRSRGVERPRLPDLSAADPEPALLRAGEAARVAVEECRANGATAELLARATELLADPTATPTLDEIAALRSRSRAKGMLAYREAVDAAVAAVAEAGEGGRAYRHVAELLRHFDERYAARKARRAGVDFEDLQLLAVRLLERSEAGASFRRRFRHVLVDEFQDTNRLQLRLIEALRGPDTELMVVGDELQSIYGFRHADVDVFRERRAAIAADAVGATLPLSGNFRSRPEIIAAVNAIGERLLGGAYAPLRVGAPPQRAEPAGGGTAVEILLTARDGWGDDEIDLRPATDARTPVNQLAEARFVAARLADLAARGVPRGSMVVLLRAFTNLDAYEDSLERAGLRPYVVGGRGYWSQQQVADVCALLASLANPLDDRSLLGALASPACGVSPDTLWLLRGAAGRGRHLWPALRQAVGADEGEADNALLDAIPGSDRALLGRFVGNLEGLRRRSTSLSLPGLIDAAVTETGYDLAVLMRPAGEARFANVRKLMRLGAEFEAAEGRDLRGFLDFLAARAEADADAQAATSVEGHDGVRIMTVHAAKGLEFDVVAIPGLGRRLLRQGAPPALMLGREPEEPRVGLRLRRLGAPAIDVFAQRELCDEAQRREAEEELRLFHVAATRARERLLLSGVVNPEPATNDSPGKPAIERIVDSLAIERGADSTLLLPPPEPRPGLEASFEPVEVAVSASVPSPERAAELTVVARAPEPPTEGEFGPAPLVERRPPRAPNRPLSYTAIAALGGDPEEALPDSSMALDPGAEGEGAGGRAAGAAHGRAVHALLEWSRDNDWREPPPELLDRLARSAVGVGETPPAPEEVLSPFRAWLGSALFQRIRAAARSRSEAPILLDVGGTVLRGSVDLLVEPEGEPPLIVDYKTDRLAAGGPAERAPHYDLQRAIYALAVGAARGVQEVDVAYVFLERPEEPVLTRMGPAELTAARALIEEAIDRTRATLPA